MSRFFKNVIALSKTPADFRKIESIPPAVTIPPVDSIPPLDRETEHTLRAGVAAVRQRQVKPRPARVAQDGHSHAEQAVYSALWDGGSPDESGNRIVTIGLGRLSKVARLTEQNCRLNIRSLIRKLALEEIAEENSRASIGKTYLVYSYSAILHRRKGAGMEWVIRTKGVSFVGPDGSPLAESITPIGAIPPLDSIGAIDTDPGIGSRPAPPLGKRPGPPLGSIPPYRNSFQEERQEQTLSSSIEETARRHGVILDDDILRRLVANCKLNDPAANDDEIAYMLAVKLQQLRGSKSVDNLPPLLVKAVPKLFPSNELQRLRTQKARELEQSRELARQVLADPDSTEKDREWARTVLTDA